MIVQRNLIDVFRIQRLNDRRGPHIAEEADLALLLRWDRKFAAAKQDVGLNADGP